MECEECSKSGLEMIDYLTNAVMDIVRSKFNINEDSDKDDELYGQIHTCLKKCLREIEK